MVNCGEYTPDKVNFLQATKLFAGNTVPYTRFIWLTNVAWYFGPGVTYCTSRFRTWLHKLLLSIVCIEPKLSIPFFWFKVEAIYVLMHHDILSHFTRQGAFCPIPDFCDKSLQHKIFI